MERLRIAAMAALVALATPALAQDLEPDPVLALGERLYRECRDCHQIGPGARSRVGPHLNGVIGRQAGALEDFRYSPGMRASGASGLVWTEQNLDRYLRNPRVVVPRTSMAFAGLRSEEERAALIAYLAIMGAGGEP
jgi:cytochrome c2